MITSRRCLGLMLAMGLVACGTPEPAKQQAVTAPPASKPAAPTPQPPDRTRDRQGRPIAAHFAPPAGVGARVSQPDRAGTYRVVLEELKNGQGWRVQDFYELSGNRFTDPYVVRSSSDFTRQPARSIDGWLRQYHHGGTRLRVQMFRDGKAAGTESRYYPDGKRQSVIIYRDDRPEGVGTFWHPNGRMALKVTFRQGRAAQFRGWDESGGFLPPELAKQQYERMTQAMP